MGIQTVWREIRFYSGVSKTKGAANLSLLRYAMPLGFVISGCFVSLLFFGILFERITLMY